MAEISEMYIDWAGLDQERGQLALDLDATTEADTTNSGTANADANLIASTPDDNANIDHQAQPPEPVEYMANMDGTVSRGYEYTEPGEVVAPAPFSSRIITTESGNKLLRIGDDYLCALSKSKFDGSLDGNHWILEPQDDATVTIGERWPLDVHGNANDKVLKVEDETEVALPDELADGLYGQRYGNPHQEARLLLKDLSTRSDRDDDTPTPPVTIIAPAQTPIQPNSPGNADPGLAISIKPTKSSKNLDVRGIIKGAARVLSSLSMLAHYKFEQRSGELISKLGDRMRAKRARLNSDNMSTRDKVAAAGVSVLAVGLLVTAAIIDNKSGGVVKHYVHANPPHRSQLDQLMAVLPPMDKPTPLHTLYVNSGHGLHHGAAAHTAAAKHAQPTRTPKPTTQKAPKSNVSWDAQLTSYDLPSKGNAGQTAVRFMSDAHKLKGGEVSLSKVLSSPTNVRLENHYTVAGLYSHFHQSYAHALNSTNEAVSKGDLVKVQPNPSKPNLYWYQVTKKGAKKAGKLALTGSTKTSSVLLVAAS